MAQEFLLGMNAKIYQGPAGSELSSLTEMGNVKDVTLTLEAGEADVTTRANQGWRATAPTLRECTAEFEMLWKPGDTGFEAIKNAFLTAGTIRLAVLAFGMIEDETPDWYSQEVLAGIDQDALEHGICIELMGSHTADMSVLAQRLSQSRPDALVVMPSTSRHALVVGEAQRLDIPCILTGTRLLDLGLPTVCEDGAQGAALAVRHLYERGHRRIGLVQRADAAPWVFHRREGYVRGLTECGIEPDERLVTWLDMPPGPAAADRLMSYLQQQQPTAVVLGSAWHARTLGLLVRDGRIRIPQDLSVVSFDQMIEGYRLHLGFVPTIVELPLRAIGRHVARLAREIVEGKSVRPITSLPCSLSEGESVGGV